MFTSKSTLAAVLLLAASGMATPLRHHHASSATGTSTAAVPLSTGSTDSTGSSSGSSAAPQKDGGLWKVEGAGSFAQHADYDFTKLTALPKGLSVSPDHIGASGSGKAQQYSASNVYVRDGVLNMKVPGGQAGAETISGSQIATDAKLLYGSVRTVAKVSKAGGTCSGFFSYNNNNLQESDIEILTSNLTAIHYTNQNPNFERDGGARSATKDGPIPSDATSAFHEYRLDWLPGKVRFYLDGKFQTEIDQYAPTTATPWVWNNWSNGDKEWSAGPPTSDNVLEIQKIEMFYNSTTAAAADSDN